MTSSFAIKHKDFLKILLSKLTTSPSKLAGWHFYFFAVYCVPWNNKYLKLKLKIYLLVKHKFLWKFHNHWETVCVNRTSSFTNKKKLILRREPKETRPSLFAVKRSQMISKHKKEVFGLCFNHNSTKSKCSFMILSPLSMSYGSKVETIPWGGLSSWRTLPWGSLFSC